MLKTFGRGLGLSAALTTMVVGLGTAAHAAPPPTAGSNLAATCLSPRVHVTRANTTGLPRAAAAKARLLYRKAAVCDRATLMRIQHANSTRLSFGLDDAAYVRHVFAVPQNDEHRYDTLVRLLSLKPLRIKEAGAVSYVWPRVFEQPHDASAWREVVDVGLLTPKQAASMRRSRLGYTGYRTFVGPKGTWDSYVAGD